MRNKLISTPFKKNFPGLSFRLFLSILLLTAITFTVLLLIGYSGASKPVSYLPEINMNNPVPDQDTVEKAMINGTKYSVSVKANGEVCIKNPGR